MHWMDLMAILTFHGLEEWRTGTWWCRVCCQNSSTNSNKVDPRLACWWLPARRSMWWTMVEKCTWCWDERILLSLHLVVKNWRRDGRVLLLASPCSPHWPWACALPAGVHHNHHYHQHSSESFPPCAQRMTVSIQTFFIAGVCEPAGWCDKPSSAWDRSCRWVQPQISSCSPNDS